MKIRTICLLVLLGCFAGLFEATFLTFLPSPFSDIRLILPIIVAFVVLQRPTHASIFAFTAGMVVDVFSQGNITFAFARFLVLAMLLGFAAETLLTNQSLYAAVAMGVVARLFDWAWLMAIQFVVHISSPHAAALVPSWSDGWRILLWDAGLIAVLFLFNTFLLKRFVAFRRIAH